MKKKKIKNIELADHLGVTPAMVSMFLNHKTTMSAEKQIALKEYIDNKVYYKYVKVEVK